MELSRVVAFLRRFAPTELAEAWDNVGLLLEPASCHVQKVLLTNDLTEPVLEEAIASRANLIVSYHPPLFSPIKRICQDEWKTRIIARCLENRIAVYSPHTSWDHVHGGINDWLAKAFTDHQYQLDYIDMFKQPEVDFVEAGIGRKLTLHNALSIEDAIRSIKNHLNLNHVRLAKPFAERETIRTIGLCAGSGSSVLKRMPHGSFDLVITGEMSHHDALDFIQNKTYVVLCEHSNTERGFLHEFKTILENHLQITAIVSEIDRDPLAVV